MKKKHNKILKLPKVIKEDIKDDSKLGVLPSEQYSCNMCGNEYLTRRKLRDHKKVKHGKLSYCSQCDKTFSSLHILKGHVNFVHENIIKVSCMKCGKGFVRVFDMYRHRVKCSVKTFSKSHKKYAGLNSKCESCRINFIDEKILETHIQTKHKLSVQIGEGINTALFNEINTNEPIKIVPKFYCDPCSEIFGSFNDLDQHNKIHLGSMEECNYCLFKFISPRKLEGHMRKSHPDIAFKCQSCQKEFFNIGDKNRHYKRVHCESVICPDCDKTYKFNQNFEIHKTRCVNIKALRPWFELTENGKRKRMNEILHAIRKRNIHSVLNKYKAKCFYLSILAMSLNERTIFQKKISKRLQLVEDVTGQTGFAVEDIIQLFSDGWLGVDITSSEVECDYCGEEFNKKSDIQDHIVKHHPISYRATNSK